MIELPIVYNKNLRHQESDWLCILLDLLSCEYVDKRLISLSSEESDNEIREALKPHMPILQTLFDSMQPESFYTFITPILVEVKEQYGLGFKWEDGKRKDIDFGKTFGSVLMENV
ncbi:hypothetical protein ACWU4D_04420 [Vibrio sp. WJH972]